MAVGLVNVGRYVIADIVEAVGAEEFFCGGAEPFEIVEVVENCFGAVDGRTGLTVVFLNVPRGETCGGIFQDVNAAETVEPIVEIALVAELTVFDAGIAPFDATIFPPAQDMQGVRVIFEGHELNAIDA